MSNAAQTAAPQPAPTDVDPHARIPRPGYGAVLAEQLRWVWARSWIYWTVLTVGLVAAVVALIWQWRPPSLEDGALVTQIVLASTVMPLTLLIGVSWALTIWRDDPPADRDYFWLQPVSRMAHTLLRVLAGALWLLLMLAAIGGAVVVAALATRTAAGDGGVLVWLLWPGAVLLAYLIGSLAALLTGRPAVWIVISFVLVAITNALARVREIDWLLTVTGWFVGDGASLSAALFAPSTVAMRTAVAAAGSAPPEGVGTTGDAVLAVLLWLGLAFGATLAAAWWARPR